jgi:O-antigen/teichoic acid export membrane protein
VGAEPISHDAPDPSRPSSYQRFALNVLITVVGRMAAIVFSFVLATVLIGTLWFERHGTWSFFYLIIGYSALFDLGLTVAIERAVARAHAHADRESIERARNLAGTVVMAVTVALQVSILLVPERALGLVGDTVVVARCLTVTPLCLAFSNAAAIVRNGLAGIQRATMVNARRVGMGSPSTLAVIVLTIPGVRRLDVLLVVYPPACWARPSSAGARSPT